MIPILGLMETLSRRNCATDWINSYVQLEKSEITISDGLQCKVKDGIHDANLSDNAMHTFMGWSRT